MVEFYLADDQTHPDFDQQPQTNLQDNCPIFTGEPRRLVSVKKTLLTLRIKCALQ